MKMTANFSIVLFVLLCTSTIAPAQSSPASRQRLLMDYNWRFTFKDPADAGTKFDYPEERNLAKSNNNDPQEQAALLVQHSASPLTPQLGSDVSYVKADFDDSQWRKLDLPHDWEVEQPIDQTSRKSGNHAVGEQWGTNIGWYRRGFDLPAEDKGKDLWVEFDGVYRNCLVWLNGNCLGRNVSGYSSFYYNLSKYANFGGKNELVVRVDATKNEGWFYEGAGIYRHVWLMKTAPAHVAHWGTFVTNKVEGSNALTNIETTLHNESAQPVTLSLISRIFDESGKLAGEVRQDNIAVEAGADQTVRQDLTLANPNLWSIETPHLYKMTSSVVQNGATTDAYDTTFGVRTLAWDANKGFFLNGKHVEIQGVCNHQDHAGVGFAIPDRLQYFRIERLKDMGTNGYRTSHNDPTPEMLDASDHLGMLVMDEHRKMGDTPEILSQIQRLVMRDRNHPSVFLWTVGNEEPIQGSAYGATVATHEQDLFHKLDPTRLCTEAMDNSWGRGLSTVIDVQGYNYLRPAMARPPFSGLGGGMDTFHALMPTKPSIGTEEASTLSTRGEYRRDPAQGFEVAYDQDAPNWGSTAADFWNTFLERPYATGGFVWTGFDYRGEPTPFRWPAVSSQFGIMDTCGFPKDVFYYYKSVWTNQPVVHLLPHWNWPDLEKTHDAVPVWVFSNCDKVELFQDGKSLGFGTGSPTRHFEWKVPYTPGVLIARGYDKDGKAIIEDKVETTGAPAAVKLVPDRAVINADGKDLSIFTVEVLDAQGRICPTAGNQINFSITGGRIIGVGNGSPSSHESDKLPQRKVFNGLAQVIVQANKTAGPIVLTGTSDGLTQASVTIQANACPLPAEVP